MALKLSKRDFFKSLLGGAAVAAVAPTLKTTEAPANLEPVKLQAAGEFGKPQDWTAAQPEIYFSCMSSVFVGSAVLPGGGGV